MMLITRTIIKNCFDLLLGGATFPYGEVASLFCISENMWRKEMRIGLGWKLISMRLIGCPYEW